MANFRACTTNVDYAKFETIEFRSKNRIQRIHFSQMMGDREFWHGMHRTLVTRSNSKDSGPTYLYRFDANSQRGNLAKRILTGENFNAFDGACHYDDCFYLFKTALNGKWDPTSVEFTTMDRMVKCFKRLVTTVQSNEF